MNPYLVNAEFEKRLAEWCGSKFAVTVESCSAALFLSLQYRKIQIGDLGNVVIPAKTYVSVPCSIIHSGGKVIFTHDDWSGEYELYPLRIWDAALIFKRGMFGSKGVMDGLQCLSFHIKKHLPIGRGGAILTDSEDAYRCLKKLRFDGRDPIPLEEDNFTMLGWNAYLEPSQAARGIQLFEVLKQKYPDGMDDLRVEDQRYADLSKFDIYKQ